jgi:hypothetical protein
MLQILQRNPARSGIGDPRLKAFAWDNPNPWFYLPLYHPINSSFPRYTAALKKSNIESMP